MAAAPIEGGALVDAPSPRSKHEADPNRRGEFARLGMSGQFFGGAFPSFLRSMALAAGLGAALAATLYFLKLDEAGRGFVMRNAMDKAARMKLIKLMVGSSGAAIAATAVAMLLAAWRKRSVVSVERWLWWFAPIGLLPPLPFCFDYRSWTGRSDHLLYASVFLLLGAEVVFFRMLLHGSDGPKRAAAWLGERIPRLLRRHGWLVAVVIASIAYGAFFSHFSLIAHRSLKTHNFDLSINNNLLYNALYGKFFESPVIFGDNPKNYLAIHVKLGQYLLLPIYAIRPSPETLLVLQSYLVGLTGIPLFLFARRRVPQWLAAIVAIGFLCFPAVHGANFFEMKYPTIAPVFIVATVWAAETRRWVWFTLSAVAAVLIRDDTCVGMAILGTCFALSGYRPKAGFSLAAFGLFAFVFTRGVLMKDKGEWWFPSMYDGLFPPGEKGFGSVFKTLMTNPLYVIVTLIERQKLEFTLHMFLPLAFLPARRAYLWAIFIPGMMFTLLTTGYKPTVSPLFHYSMHWSPYLFLAAPIALGAIARESVKGKLRASAAGLTMALLMAVFTYNFGAFWMRNTTRGGYTRIDFEFTAKDQKRYAQLMELVKMIPADATVSASESVGPHVSTRREMYAIRMKWGKQMGEYVLVSDRELNLERTTERLKEILKVKKSHGLVATRGEFVLMKRGADTSHNAELIRRFKIR